MSSSPPPGRRPVWRRRLLAVSLGTVLVPVIGEIALRVCALFVAGDRAAAGAALVVCQGDSNTFGLHVEPDEAYPAALEALLAERGVADARVVNRGVPGKPSWIVAEELVRDLERFRPRAVVVLVGVNDRNQLRPDDGFARLLERSRFARMLLRTWSNAVETASATPRDAPDDGQRPDETPAFEMEFGYPEEELATRWTREELARIVERVRAAGATPILLTYFDRFDTMEAPSGAAVAVARQTGARVVDLREVFLPAIRELGRDVLEFPDAHLRPVGYRVLARVLFNALVEERVIAAEPLEDVLAPLAELELEAPHVEPWLDGGELRGVRIRHEPGLRAQLVLSGRVGTTAVRFAGIVRSASPYRATTRLPLYSDDTLSASMRRAPDYTIRLDASGAGEIALLPDERQVAPLWACVAFVDDRNRIRCVSAPVELR